MDWTAFALSLKLAFWTCVLILPVAVLLARLLAWGRFRGKSVIESLVMLPLVLPPTVLGFYLLSAFSPVSWFGAVLKSIFGVPLVFSFPGILVASVIINLPFAVQPIQRAFEAIAPNVREAAFVSGLSPLRTMRFVELPLAWPGIMSALALVMAHTLGEFGVILMMAVAIGQFTRPERFGEETDLFFVAAEERLSPEEFDALQIRAGRSAANEQTQTSAEVYRGSIAQSLPIVYSYQ
jgi:molybdate transport system permease protein